jgi:hypothetical protein
MDVRPTEAKSLLLFAMDHATAWLRDAAGPLAPFVVFEGDEHAEQLRTFPADTQEESLSSATRFLATECEGCRAVLVYDGMLTQGDSRWSAIYAESIDEHGAVAVVAQRYRPRTRLRRFESIGNPIHLAVKGVL